MSRFLCLLFCAVALTVGMLVPCRAEEISVSATAAIVMDADTGEVLGCAVRADVTVTFSALKPGLVQGEGSACAGKVVVADIGIPADLLEGRTKL